MTVWTTSYTSHMLKDDDLCDIDPREIEDSMEIVLTNMYQDWLNLYCICQLWKKGKNQV